LLRVSPIIRENGRRSLGNHGSQIFPPCRSGSAPGVNFLNSLCLLLAKIKKRSLG
jgi:hypothetical protein